MKKLVLDSSVIVKFVNQDNESRLEKADQILRDVQSGKVSLVSPELAKYEVGNALVKKGLKPGQAFQSLGTVSSLPIQFVPETLEMARETYQMAHEVRSSSNKKFTYYDAAFAALAKQEGAALITDNPKHQSKIGGVKVVPLEKYK